MKTQAEKKYQTTIKAQRKLKELWSLVKTLEPKSSINHQTLKMAVEDMIMVLDHENDKWFDATNKA